MPTKIPLLNITFLRLWLWSLIILDSQYLVWWPLQQWSQHRMTPCASGREPAQFTPRDTQPRGIFSSQSVPGPLGGFQMTTISILVLFSHLVSDGLTLHCCSKAKPPAGLDRTLSILLGNQIHYHDQCALFQQFWYWWWPNCLHCGSLSYNPLSLFLFRDHIAPSTSQGCCKNNRLKLTKNCL